MRPRIEPLPGLAAVARAHHQAVLTAQESVLIVGHLDAEDAEVGADIDSPKSLAAVLSQQHLAAIADDKCPRRTGRPHVEELVGEADVAHRHRRYRNFAMTRHGRERD